VVLIRCSKKAQENRLLQRGLTHKQIETRLSSQYSYGKKKRTILESIKKDGYGAFVEINNYTSNLELNLNKIIESFK
jgi:dephospho-CoA kinase